MPPPLPKTAPASLDSPSPSLVQVAAKQQLEDALAKERKAKEELEKDEEARHESLMRARAEREVAEQVCACACACVRAFVRAFACVRVRVRR